MTGNKDSDKTLVITDILMESQTIYL
jgi:hypothetical protein